MPTRETAEYPKPKDAYEFEDIVWDIFKRKWNDPNAKRYGSSGDPQQGVDVYGQPMEYGGGTVGMQCKRYNKLDKKIVIEEITKAEEFIPPLSHYIIATTASRDSRLQEAIRLINLERKSQEKFTVEIQFWEDLTKELAKDENQDLLRKHFPTWFDQQDYEKNSLFGSILFEDGRPVENAYVRVIGLDLEHVNTDSDGFFKFIVDDQPSWILHATYQGMSSKTIVEKGQIDQSIIIQFPYLACFSVDSPIQNEEIPLGEKQERVLEGSFPILASNPILAETADVNVEVRTYPEGVPVEQNGKCKISLYQGKWYYESAKFSGEGVYDITATASVGKIDDFRRIRVNCIQKDKYYKRAIEEDLKIRGVSGLRVIKREDTNLDQVKWKFKQILYQKQNEFFTYFFAGDLERASLTVGSTLEIVDQILPEFLPVFPDDLWLQQVRAYTFKNYAMLMRAYNREDEFLRGLSEAEKMFRAVRDQDPEDAGAWNGLGSVAALRGEYKKALDYIEKALEICPQYDAALRDKEMVLQRINKQA
jgi:hypothetical protein